MNLLFLALWGSRTATKAWNWRVQHRNSKIKRKMWSAWAPTFQNISWWFRWPRSSPKLQRKCRSISRAPEPDQIDKKEIVWRRVKFSPCELKKTFSFQTKNFFSFLQLFFQFNRFQFIFFLIVRNISLEKKWNFSAPFWV